LNFETFSCANMISSAAELRRAKDGKMYSWQEFHEHYGEWADYKWAEAQERERVSDDDGTDCRWAKDSADYKWATDGADYTWAKDGSEYKWAADGADYKWAKYGADYKWEDYGSDYKWTEAQESECVNVDDFFRRLDLMDYTQFQWDDYCAPDELKFELQCVAHDLDPVVLQRLHKLKTRVYGDAHRELQSVPVLLFHGPPGTGKTLAMKTLASQSGLQPWVLDVKGLFEQSFMVETLFARILHAVENLSNAIVFFDECESVFMKRSVLAEYASVNALAHKKVINNFISWVEGLETKSEHSRRRLVLCLATNTIDDLDPAIRDRVRRTIKFDLPTERESTKWWSRHALQLTSSEHAGLGRCSEGLSYRNLWSISEKVVRVHAARSLKHGHCGEPRVGDYALEICRFKSQNAKTLPEKVAAFMQILERVVFVLSRCLYVRDSLHFMCRL